MKELAPSAGRPWRAQSRAGFTLLELLMVTVILGLLFGIGLGVVSSLDLGRRAALSSVQSVVRSARNSAVARAAPARVLIDQATGSIRAEGQAIVGTWHFEGGGDFGALDQPFENRGGRTIEDGYIGRALAFAGAPTGSTCALPVASDPGFDLGLGFTLDVALNLEEDGGGRALNLGNVVGLEVTSEGILRGWIVPTAFDKTGTAIPGGRAIAESEPGGVARGRWVRARLTYDRELLRVFADGVELGRAQEVGPVWKPEGPLWICDPKTGFPGTIDELSVLAVTASSDLKLPDTVTFAADAPPEIRFAAGGGLDREYHPQPVAFHLVYQDGAERELRVGLYGTVE